MFRACQNAATRRARLIPLPTLLKPHYNQTMMQLTVRLFALYRERAGQREFVLELPEGATVADLTGAVRRRFPQLAPPEVNIVVAVNADYAEPEDILNPGDDVCLIPPVSGG